MSCPPGPLRWWHKRESMQVAYRAIRSRRKFVKAPQIRKCLARGMEKTVAPHFVQCFDRVVCNWDHKPEFQARGYVFPNSNRVTITPVGEHRQIYIWVTGGTRPHSIPTAGPSFLSFMLGYKPKTAPGGKFGGPGTYSGPRVSGIMQVQHPGYEGSHFEPVIAKDEKGWYSRTMEILWRQCIRAA